MGAVTERLSPGRRLDSWKAIADYLQRDVATVARWEKNLGLPVRRVAGAGRSVFADTAEIDEWLRTNSLAETDRTTPLARPVLPAPVAPSRTHFWPGLVLTAVVVALVIGVLGRPRPLTADELRIDMTSDGVTARDAAGVEQWRHPFQSGYRTLLITEPVQVIGGANPGVYFATGGREQRANERAEGGVLTRVDLAGKPQGSFSFADRVTFAGRSYGPPWNLTAFAVREDRGRQRIAVTAHHWVWDPGLVTILDEHWQRRGTFVHAGWIEQVRWLGPERLLIGGFSNARDGGTVSLLDASALEGQGPEPAGSPHFCESCATGGPLRTYVFPRSELNRVTASRFNRVTISSWDTRVVAQTIEVPSERGDATAIYELTASLDLISAKFNERYWEMHRALEIEGKLTHSREQCPDRDGPRQIRMWAPAEGWRTPER